MCQKYVIKMVLGLVTGVWVLLGMGGGEVLGMECNPGLKYQFDGGDYVKIEVVKRQELKVKLGGKNLARLSYGRLRLFYPSGVVYGVGKLSFKGMEGGLYVWSGMVELKKDYKYLVVEVDVVGARSRRRGRVGWSKGRIYLQTAVDKNGGVPFSLDWGSWCWSKSVIGRVVIGSLDDQIDQVKVSLIDRFKRRLSLGQVEVKKRGSEYEVKFVIPPFLIIKDDWYSLQIDITELNQNKKNKRIIAFPVWVVSKESDFKIYHPQKGDKLEGVVDVMVKGISQFEGKMSGWYRRKGESWICMGEEKKVNEGQINTVIFDWNTDNLKAGVYELKVKLLNVGGEEVERVVPQLYKIKPSGGFGIKVMRKVQLPELIVATLDQVIEGWIGESGGDEAVRIYDQRGVEAGWVLTAKFSDLYSPQADNFIKAKGLLWIKPGPIQVYQGSDEGVTVGQPVMIDQDEQWVVLSQASPSYGEGVYGQSVFIKWLIPANTPAGDYKGTIVFTLQ